MGRFVIAIPLATCLCLAAVLKGCEGGQGGAQASGIASIDLRAAADSSYPAAGTSTTHAEGVARHAMTVPVASEVRAIARAPDFGEISRVVPATARWTSLYVPWGPQRQFVLEYYGSCGSLLGSGITTVTVDRPQQVVEVPVVPGIRGVWTKELSVDPPCMVKTTQPVAVSGSFYVTNTLAGPVTIDDVGMRFRDAATLAERTGDTTQSWFPSGAVIPSTSTTLFSGQIILQPGAPGRLYRVDAMIHGRDAAGRPFGARTSSPPAQLRTIDALTLYTVSGNGSPMTTGDGHLASDPYVGYYGPWGVISDSEGQIYICERSGNTVRRIKANGVVETLVNRGGSPGNTGLDGPAIDARLDSPRGIALDSMGRVLVADTGNNRIVAFEPGGRLWSIAGTGSATGSIADGIPAVKASLFAPEGVVFDARTGDVLVADTGHGLVRRIDPASGLIYTVAGDPTATDLGDGGPATSANVRFPVDMAFDDAGNLLIAHSVLKDASTYMTGLVRRVCRQTGTITTVIGSKDSDTMFLEEGSATGISVHPIRGMVCDPGGWIYFSETTLAGGATLPARNRIWVKTPENRMVPIAGQQMANWEDGYPAQLKYLDAPMMIRRDALRGLLVADFRNHRIRAVR